VSVDIEHTYIGDLEVDLIAPSGRHVRLHDNVGRSSDDIRRSYDFDTTPALRALEHESIQGEWKLAVRDLARRDVGTLKNWSIKINY
jgi:subtilisin-like proprotein convertase family protein